jgi:hypothetical protein
MSDIMKTTFVRIVREFWLPFLLAISWTIYSGYVTPDKRNLSHMMPVFAGAFFLLSWMTGQVVRVKRQVHVEGKLGDVIERLNELVGLLEGATNRLISTSTGGNSFAYLALSEIGTDIKVIRETFTTTFRSFVLHVGDYPLYNVSVRIYKIGEQKSEASYQLGDLEIGICNLLNEIRLENVNYGDFNIFFTARNGIWTQLLRLRLVKGEWKHAFIIMKKGILSPVYGEVPPDFPFIGDPLFDNFERGENPRFAADVDAI